MSKIRKKSFAKWIEEIGVRELATLLNVRPSAISYWRHGKFYPRCDQMREIKKLSRGAVGYDQIIDSPENLKRLRKGK